MHWNIVIMFLRLQVKRTLRKLFVLLWSTLKVFSYAPIYPQICIGLLWIIKQTNQKKVVICQVVVSSRGGCSSVGRVGCLVIGRSLARILALPSCMSLPCMAISVWMDECEALENYFKLLTQWNILLQINFHYTCTNVGTVCTCLHLMKPPAPAQSFFPSSLTSCHSFCP